MQPYPSKLSFFEKLQLYLLDDDDNIPNYHKFTPKELEVKKRYANVFAFWIDKPTLSEKKIIQYLIREFGIKKSQAYRDMHTIKILLGNVNNAKKEWQRFKVIAMIDKAFEIAERKKSAKDMINAANALIKATQLDKEDQQKIPFEEIVPPTWEITDDVTVLGVPAIENAEELKEKLRKKYGGALIEDAQLIKNDE